MKFIKENKVFIIALAVIVLTGILLVLPGQSFATCPNSGKFSEHFNGFQFMFGRCKSIAGTKIGGVVPAGIAFVVLTGLNIVALHFSKKSSFIAMLTGLSMFISSILLFTFTSSARKVYKSGAIDYLAKDFGRMGWAVWLSASLMLLAAALVIYKSVLMLKDEMKRPAKSNNGPSYNYLKK